MKSNRILLLKTFLKASSKLNILRNTKDKKKKSGIIGNAIGFGLVYMVLLIYALIMSIALGQNGMTDMIPSLCTGMIVGVSFVFTVLKSNGYLYGFREYDILISMPFTEKDIVSAKFLYMYVKSLPMLMVLTVAMLAGYLIGGAGNALTVVLWCVLSLVLPVIPMLLASAIGAFIVRVGVNFKYKKMIQTVLTFIVVIPCFFANYIIQELIKNHRMETVMKEMSAFFDKASKIFSPADWFVKAVNDNNVLYALLLIGASAVVLEVFFVVVCKSYRMINSRLNQSTAGKKYKMTAQKTKSVVNSIAFKEFRRMLGSSTYMVQVGMGTILTILIAIAFLFIKGDVIISKVTQGAPVSPKMLIPAIPLIVHFMAGMVTSTACTPSLEGKNDWIIKTLPIDPLDDCKGKVLFQLYLAGPAALLATLSMCYSFKTSLIEAVGAGVVICLLCLYTATWGLRCGLKHKRLDWENEIEVVKQSAAVTVYLLPNMIITMILIVAVVALNNFLNNVMVIYGMIALVALLLSFISWQSVKNLIRKGV